MVLREKIARMKQLLHKAAESLDDADALNAVEFFASWKPNEYFEKGERRRHDGVLYRCEQSHTSQEDWTPDLTPALWTPVAEPGEIPVWKQPTGAQDAYQTGNKVYYPTKDDDIFVSLVDNNVWPPDVYGWRKE